MQNSTEARDSHTNFKYDAFISYSSRDGDWVRKHLLTALETAGLKACIDYRDFEIGLPTLVNIEKAVERSRKTLLVLTPSWLSSNWTDFEALLIQTQDPAAWGRRILPLMVVKTELPKRLEMLTYLDLTDHVNLDFQLKRLINNISNNNTPQEKSWDKLDARQPSKTITSTSPTINSDFSYFKGLAIMSKQLQTANIDIQLTFSTLDARLQENIRDENMFGSSETLRNERNRIVYQLNSLGLKYLKKTFNKMCGI
ncbi:MAG: toll/interleukin-1 receptor domain-containing protein [Pleurocapsa sp. MO_226.B13]|nr:toll/interleukin-1 receptor domain-containing protein [Pleurocapsa sp. MO_226.B13]